MKLTAQMHRLTERLGPNQRNVEHFPSPYTSTTMLLQAYLQQFLSPFSFFVLLSRKRLLGLLKGQNHNVKRQSKHRTRHDRDVGIIRLGIEVSLISMVRVLGDKGDSMQGKMDNMSRDGNPKKEPQRDARDKKHWNRNEECFWWAY